MNPSASDWILKFLSLFDKDELTGEFNDEVSFYKALKDSGFVYGISVAVLSKKPMGSLKFTKEELTKVNLFHALIYQYFKFHKDATNQDAIESILAFYQHLEKGKTGFFHKFSFSNRPSLTLENILSARLQEANTLLKRNTLSLLTYALLFLDVLAFKHWLRDPKTVKDAYKQLEEGVLNYCFFTLKSKQKKSKYDKLLIELFETSNEYVMDWTVDGSANFLHKMEYLRNADELEKKYILDLCCLTIWEDLKMDESEFQYLLQIIEILDFPEEELIASLIAMESFSKKHTQKIVLFEYSNLVKHFYKNSASTVKLLIMRNSSRLVQELEESGELVMLLGQSTLRDLSSEEKTKVKNQLLDVCKTIPSLTIFLLPGGSVLMPLLVKFIPKLLPSAFQENRIIPPKK